jgi:hypothetical protein
MIKKTICLSVFILIFFLLPGISEELPLPTYANSLICSIEHNILDSEEVDYILSHFDFGLYAWPSFSRTAITVNFDWHSSLDEAPEGIQSFKDTVESMIAAAVEKNVRLHFVITSGLARGLSVYREAKEEDIRNCQWYNDNKLASDSQISAANTMDAYVFGTLSRYARKVRANLEAKARAVLAFFKQKMNQHPGVIIGISGWGEVEFSFHRINNNVSLQEYFCDYSPFTILEFADWIRHQGLYADAAGKYKGEGYTGGGTQYQGGSGLNQFNQDFGTDFSTWDLKYFNWSLEDDYDQNPEDSANGDPQRIPFSSYVHGEMMPSSGPAYTAGGFDPPRTMAEPGNAFWDLWNLFRETVVHHFLIDMAKWALEAGIPADNWYSHQIPGDYLFGTNPETPNKNARYYTSASPIWTADILPYGSPGATIYDIKFPDWFARTTTYGLQAASELHSNWAIMEYDPETYPYGLDVPESSAEFILEEYIKVYNHNAHLINFWRWWDGNKEHRIKGMNKEEALRQFILRVRDKARKTDMDFVFDPPRVTRFSGQYMDGGGSAGRRARQAEFIRIEIERYIWLGHPWEWKQWGDFSHFEIYRGDQPGFTADEAHLLATSTDYIYDDSTAQSGKFYFYKIRAVNSKGVAGPFSPEIKLPSFILTLQAGGRNDRPFARHLLTRPRGKHPRHGRS